MSPGPERLQKLISHSGIAPRRVAEEWIAEGRVTVNGETAILGGRADLSVDDVRVDGRALPRSTDRIYLALNKPAGYTCTRSDPHAEVTVMELLEGVSESVYPVGRLDVETEGLILLTNDGEFANRLTHPRYKVPKLYEALVEGAVGKGAARALRDGVELEDGFTLPTDLRVVATQPSSGRHEARSILRLTLYEGRKRQVRRMLEAVGHPVIELRRVRIGNFELGDLPLGSWRRLLPKEVWGLLQDARDQGPGRRESARGDDRGGDMRHDERVDSE